MSALAIAADAHAPLDARAFGIIAHLLHSRAGIAIEPHKRTLVRSRLLRRLREHDLASFDDYLAIVDTDDTERDLMIAALTTNHTKFFREPHHFDHLISQRDGFVRRMAAGQVVSIWSAGCSTGQEPYTIAMALAGANSSAAAPFLGSQFRILGTDLAPHAIAAARGAAYPAELLADIPAAHRTAWTRRDGDQFLIAPELVRQMRFNHLNFIESWPIRSKFAAIFCRNVMIYFDEPTKEKLLIRLADALEPGGTLYIGHSERLFGPAAKQFRQVALTAFAKEPAR
jgi:chemotaxis protein methyltransferase CheR